MLQHRIMSLLCPGDQHSGKLSHLKCHALYVNIDYIYNKAFSDYWQIPGILHLIDDTMDCEVVSNTSGKWTPQTSHSTLSNI